MEYKIKNVIIKTLKMFNSGITRVSVLINVPEAQTKNILIKKGENYYEEQ